LDIINLKLKSQIGKFSILIFPFLIFKNKNLLFVSLTIKTTKQEILFFLDWPMTQLLVRGGANSA